MIEPFLKDSKKRVPYGTLFVETLLDQTMF